MNPNLKKKDLKGRGEKQTNKQTDYVRGPVIMKVLPGANFMFDAQ